jgi:arylsulfatase A-like enzyme
VLPELQPDVVINWLTEPDHSQHHVGVGSSDARAALRHDDAEIARVLERLEGLGLSGQTEVLVASDHGFSTNSGGVDVVRAIVDSGLKAAVDSRDVALASSGQAVALHVEGRDADRIARLARLIQSQDWGGVVFTAGRAPGDWRGAAAGTFSLELIHAASSERGADLVATFPWTSAPNAHGVAGTDLACVSGGAKLYASDHGSMSPWNVRNTLFAWGPRFKRRTTVRVAAGNVDVTPTVLALGVDRAAGASGEGAVEMDGRVLSEALEGGPDSERVTQETRVLTTAAGAYRAAIQLSEVDGRRYVDKSWRIS